MRITVIAMSCCFGLTVAFCAAAAETPKAQDKQLPDSQKIECRVGYHEGMVVRTRHMCQTKAYWEARRYQTQRDINDIQIRALTTNPR
ncbi:MAG: hypothetical protein KGR48_05505 [Alphaproteobacteria bacterium]|nr:hypothetical protein [Alphaproteobacteria bacterium]MBU6471075.1 hypothetical protein [Alphaproteobacteria bacterium]MDE2012488.1 hypothetical protein [Alphaproteobacteria bacterium]MDE2072786.1 hypothetical protein [Alphaproteobacteria bacterium]MDE2352377.1 hypothetical protein [Alphaproteobacteria bacterium]